MIMADISRLLLETVADAAYENNQYFLALIKPDVDMICNLLSIHPRKTYVCLNMGYSVFSDIIDTINLCFHQLQGTHRNWHAGV
jgi:hypothetical protein